MIAMRFMSGFSAIMLLVGFVAQSHAVLVTGDPSADAGWNFNANVLDNGSYIRGAANFGFNMYSTSFAADPVLAASIGAGWEAGDTILAVGGKRQTTNGIDAGWGAAFTGDAVNSNLNASARVVVKFGTGVFNSVTTSTVRPGSGDGVDSFSGGNLGTGAILLGSPNSGGFFVTANEGQYLTFLTNQRYDGGVSNIANSFGRIIFQLGGDGLLDTWEVVLNTTLLSDLVAEVPTVGQRSVWTMQNGNSSTRFSDGLITITAVPEASSVLFGALVCCVLGLAAARPWLRSKLSPADKA